MARIGLLGGSFNPAHGGHRHISLWAMKRLRLDAVWWLVSPGNPLKDGADMAPLPARLHSAKAVARHPRIVPQTLESHFRTRYTVDTLKMIKARFPQHRFIWLMGADNLAQFHRWRQWRNIARTMPIAVLARPHYIGDSLTAPSVGWLRRFRKDVARAGHWTEWTLPAWAFLPLPLDPTSATALRARNPGWSTQLLKQHPAPVPTGTGRQ